MKLEKKCVVCEGFVNKQKCTSCGNYCVKFDDGSPYIDIPIDNGLESVYLTNNLKDVIYYVYDADKGRISVNDDFTYYDQDFETFRIFPNTIYDCLVIKYYDGEVN